LRKVNDRNFTSANNRATPTEKTMRRTTLFLAAITAPVAANGADGAFQFRFTADPANMTACIALAPQFEREHTLTVAGDTVRITGPGGLSDQMKPVKPNVYQTELALAGERLDYVVDLDAKTVSVRGNNLGCTWSAKLR
jgi:hypothetical protein